MSQSLNILFFQAGGTIDKDYPRQQEGYAFEITEPAVERILKRSDPAFEFEVRTLLRKDSLDLDDADRAVIYEACAGAAVDRIVITHGSDTLLETAKRLAPIKGKTIVLTGSFRPERFSETDADFNLGLAVGAVSLLGEGVYVAMSGKILPFDRVRRDRATGQFIEK